MKNFLLITVVCLLSLNQSYSQARSQLNFGLIGISYDIPVSENIAISPFAGTDFNLDWLIAGVKANYYFDNLLGLPDAWDVYGGANAGFGIDGAATYSIWLYKGGPQCHHFWSRRIYKTVIGESKTTKIEDADMIGYTKAKSEGFTAKKNDKLVATPPRKMKNNGYYN